MVLIKLNLEKETTRSYNER